MRNNTPIILNAGINFFKQAALGRYINSGYPIIDAGRYDEVSIDFSPSRSSTYVTSVSAGTKVNSTINYASQFALQLLSRVPFPTTSLKGRKNVSMHVVWSPTYTATGSGALPKGCVCGVVFPLRSELSGGINGIHISYDHYYTVYVENIAIFGISGATNTTNTTCTFDIGNPTYDGSDRPYGFFFTTVTAWTGTSSNEAQLSLSVSECTITIP